MEVDYCWHKDAIENAIENAIKEDGPYGLVHMKYAVNCLHGDHREIPGGNQVGQKAACFEEL